MSRMIHNLVRLRARRNTLYLSRGRVLATDRDGFIRAGSAHGLFIHETRVLSRYRLLIDGRTPEPEHAVEYRTGIRSRRCIRRRTRHRRGPRRRCSPSCNHCSASIRTRRCTSSSSIPICQTGCQSSHCETFGSATHRPAYTSGGARTGAAIIACSTCTARCASCVSPARGH
jgi:hypothetical protein